MKKVILIFILSLIMNSLSMESIAQMPNFATEVQAAEYIDKQVFLFEQDITFSTSLNCENPHEVWWRITGLMNPEARLFFDQELVTYQNMDGKNVFRLKPKYKINKAQFLFSLSKVKIYATSLKGATEIETVLNVHDFVKKTMVYDTNPTATIVDGVVSGKGLCSSYSILAKRLFDELGIESGYALGYPQEGYHMWNVVKVKGSWYHMDITYNDALNSYKYFLVGDDLIRAERNKLELSAGVKISNSSYLLSAKINRKLRENVRAVS